MSAVDAYTAHRNAGSNDTDALVTRHAELVKRIAFLNGIPVPSLEDHYERPTQ